MTKKPQILCLINARGGSKGVPGKNIKILGEIPLIGYSIRAAQKSKYVSRIIVSTDCPDIAKVARDFGADVPFIRPPELATDKAKQIDAVIHAIKYAEAEGMAYDYVCILQPTCPFRSVEDIDGSISLMISRGTDSVITVTDVGGRHPNTLYRMEEGNIISPYLEMPKSGVLRQEFENLYWRTGSVYAMKTSVVLSGTLYGSSTCGYLQDEERAFNIDSPFDWNLCEAYLQYQSQK